MNRNPIATAKDPDLRQSLPAMQRAAQRARALAAQTGTTIVISHEGIVEHLRPEAVVPAASVQEPPAPYDSRP